MEALNDNRTDEGKLASNLAGLCALSPRDINRVQAINM